jgi:glycerol kinase
LLHRLGGAFVTDVATASRSLLLDLETTRWSPEAARIFRIDVESLPEIVDNDAVVAETSVFGGRSVPISGQCVDQQAALWAEGCAASGEAKCTYGTGAFLLTSTGTKPTRSAAGLVGCVAWRVDDQTTWCLDGQVYTVGSAVTWLQQLGLITDPSELDVVGGSVPGCDGVQFVPALAGLGAPFWEPNARGAWSGLSLATERAHLVRSVVEGIAAQVAVLCQSVADDLGRPLRRLRVDGGLTRSRLLLQLQADLAQVPIEVYPSPHATALGVASMAAIGAGVTDARPDWSPTLVVEPTIGADEASERLAHWRGAADVTF